MKNILLDTNAYVNLLAGDQIILEFLSQAENVYMSTIVLGELFSGFRGGTKQQSNIKMLNKFLSKPTINIVNVSRDTAEIFAEVKNYLKTKGKPIPINDVWIAAHAVETSSILISYDKHFGNIPMIRLGL